MEYTRMKRGLQWCPASWFLQLLQCYIGFLDWRVITVVLSEVMLASLHLWPTCSGMTLRKGGHDIDQFRMCAMDRTLVHSHLDFLKVFVVKSDTWRSGIGTVLMQDDHPHHILFLQDTRTMAPSIRILQRIANNHIGGHKTAAFPFGAVASSSKPTIALWSTCLRKSFTPLNNNGFYTNFVDSILRFFTSQCKEYRQHFWFCGTSEFCIWCLVVLECECRALVLLMSIVETLAVSGCD